MKTIISSLAVALFLLMSLPACTGNNQQQAPATSQQAPTNGAQSKNAIVDPQSLPEHVTAFIKQYFPDAQVSLARSEREFGGLEYDVTLNDGTEIDFEAGGDWDNVDCKTKAVPEALVPKAISEYVKANYAQLLITKIDKDRNGFDIDLSNGSELKFDLNGKFLMIDD